MTVVAYDPYASQEKAAALGVKIVTLDEALEQVRRYKQYAGRMHRYC
jgi:phosphoglycerate dehydrogenase-like enzyme